MKLPDSPDPCDIRDAELSALRLRLALGLDISDAPLEERVRRLYGRNMQPLKVEPVAAAPEPAWRPESAGLPAGATIASLVDPFARHM